MHLESRRAVRFAVSEDLQGSSSTRVPTLRACEMTKDQRCWDADSGDWRPKVEREGQGLVACNPQQIWSGDLHAHELLHCVKAVRLQMALRQGAL